MPKNKATGQFESKVRLPQSSGLRLPPELRKQVECIADGQGVTYSDALRTLVEEALRTRTGHLTAVEGKIAATLGTMQHSIDMLYRGENDRFADDKKAREEARQWRNTEAEHIALALDLARTMEEVLRRSPGIQAGIERRLAAIEERVGAQVYPAALLQRLDEIQHVCTSNWDKLATLAAREG